MTGRAAFSVIVELDFYNKVLSLKEDLLVEFGFLIDMLK